MSHPSPPNPALPPSTPRAVPAAPAARSAEALARESISPDHHPWTIQDQADLQAAWLRVRRSLRNERNAAGHWTGELCSSALATATAVSALALVERHDPTDAAAGCYVDEHRETWLSELIMGGIRWLAEHQNEDGGWGDTDQSYSNIATTMLAVAAFSLTGVPAKQQHLMERAEAYIDRAGGIAGLRRRYGRDKTFAVPILTNYALAGRVSWKKVAPLPFELACLPQQWYRFAKLPVVSYAIPALVAVGQVKYFHDKPWDPIRRGIRGLAVTKSLEVLERMQPESGGYLEAIPLTSFVIMSLAGSGRSQHPVVQKGVEFLVSSVRPDGSWPIDTNLATWNTSLALAALDTGSPRAQSFEPEHEPEAPAETAPSEAAPSETASAPVPSETGAEAGGPDRCFEWLLDCQYREVHPFTGAEPGGWGWSDLSGAVPDADDTPAALLVLAGWRDSGKLSDAQRARVTEAAGQGLRWLMNLQNRDGGWPTFCRGWGKLPFDRSGADLTAHALRALEAWRLEIERGDFAHETVTAERQQLAQRKAWRFLMKQQRADGSWIPLWFGNQDHPQEENPIYGTAKVLFAYRDCNLVNTPAAERGWMWLKSVQNPDGGWGGGPAETAPAKETAVHGGGADGEAPRRSGSPARNGSSMAKRTPDNWHSSIEETALALEALLAEPGATGPVPGTEAGKSPETSTQVCIYKGLQWLAAEIGRLPEPLHPSPIGFYFAKLWYYERLYPLIFTVSALGRASEALLPPPPPASPA